MMKKIAVIGAVLALMGATACSSDTQGKSDGPVKLGVAVPLSGPLAQVGSSMELAAKYATKEINDAGGVDGRKVELVVADTTEDPTRAGQEINRLLTQEHIDFLLGPATTDMFAATYNTVTQANIPQLHGSGSTDYTPAKAPNSFSYTASVPDQASAMVKYAVSKGYKSVAVVEDNGQYGKAAGASLREALTAQGIKVTTTREYKAGDADMTALMLAVQKSKPDAVMVFASNGDDTGHVLKAAQDVTLNLPIIGNYGTTFVGPAKQIAGDNAYKNVVAVTYPGVGSCAGQKPPEATINFENKLREFDKDTADKSNLDFVAIIRDGLLLMARGINGADSFDGGKVAAWLEQNAASKSTDEGLINTPIAISKDTHFLTGADSLVAVKPGTTVAPGVYVRADC